MIKATLLFVLSCAALVVAAPATVHAHPTGNEGRSPSECDVLMGSALSGPRAECLRCIARPHYHYHSDLPRRQRCHRENRNPNPPPRRRRR